MERIKTQRVLRKSRYPLHETAAMRVNKMSLTDLLTLWTSETLLYHWWWLSLLCKLLSGTYLFTNVLILPMFLSTLEFVINHWTTFGFVCCLYLPLGIYICIEPSPPIIRLRQYGSRNCKHRSADEICCVQSFSLLCCLLPCQWNIYWL